MGKRRRASLMAAVFSAGLLALGASPVSAETLAEAIALAYSTNPQLLTQRSALRNQDEAYYRVARGIGPTVTADIVVTGDTDNDLNDSFKGSSSAAVTAGLNVSQPVYTGGRISANLKAQEAALQAAREDLRRVEMSVIQNVVQVYTAVRRAEQQLAITRENVAVLQRQREEAQARFEVGNQTRTDVAQAESRLAQARSSLTSAQNTLDNARAQYRTVVGRMPEQLQPEPVLTSYLPASQALAFQTAEQNNPTLRTAYLRERQSAAGVVSAKAARRPQITVGANLSANETNSAFARQSGFDFGSGFGTSARLSIPLYTGLTTSSTIRSAQETNRSDNIAIESQRRTLNQTVTESWNALVAARATVISQEEAVRASRLAVEGTREEQQVGLRTTLELLNAEQELRGVQQNEINARFTEYTSQVALLNAMGQLTPEVFGAQVEKYDPKKHFEEVNDFGLPWEGLILTIDQMGAAPIPQREPIAGENVPNQEPLR